MAHCPELATGTQEGRTAWGAGGRSAGKELDRASDVGRGSEFALAMVQEWVTRMQAQARMTLAMVQALAASALSGRQ